MTNPPNEQENTETPQAKHGAKGRPLVLLGAVGLVAVAISFTGGGISGSATGVNENAGGCGGTMEDDALETNSEALIIRQADSDPPDIPPIWSTFAHCYDSETINSRAECIACCDADGVSNASMCRHNCRRLWKCQSENSGVTCSLCCNGQPEYLKYQCKRECFDDDDACGPTSGRECDKQQGQTEVDL